MLWDISRSLSSHSIHFPPYSVRVIHISIFLPSTPLLSPPGAISQSKFYPTDETALPPPPRLQISADRDWSVISFPGSRCSGGGGGAPALQTSPVCYPIYPSSLFSSRWLLMRLRSNLLSATRPPTKHCRRKKKLWCFFHLLRFVGGDLTCVRGHYAVAHDPRRERRRISVFNQTTTADR